MAKIYAGLIQKSKKTLDDVPDKLKAAVKEVLRSRVASETITAERYEEITGEAYGE